MDFTHLSTQTIAQVSSILLITGIAAVYAYKTLEANRAIKPALPLPPGPRGLPFIGPLLEMGKKPHETFAKWGEKYGPIFSLQLGAQTLIVITSAQVVQDLFVNRSRIYSSRNFGNLMRTVMHKNCGVVFEPYGPTWKQWRRLAKKVLRKENILQYQQYFVDESTSYINHLYKRGHGPAGVDPHEESFLYSLNIILRAMFNRRCDSTDDELYKALVNHVLESVEIAQVAGQMMNLFPSLSFLFKKEVQQAEQWGTRTMDIYGKLVEEIREQMNAGKDIKGMVVDLIKEQEKEKFENEALYTNCNILVMGANDTTGATLVWLLCVLVNHPEVQDKAYAELMDVVGTDRLPNVEDWYSLPYIHCIIKENMRFRPTVTIGFPHATAEEDEYNGYRIPKDAVVMINQYSIVNDETLFNHADQFDPERHLDHCLISSADLALRGIGERDHWGFGESRRMCLGIHFAELSMFLAAAKLLWAFKIEKAVDPKTGAPINVPMDTGKPGITVLPNNFNVRFVPRHENVEELLSSSPL